MAVGNHHAVEFEPRLIDVAVPEGAVGTVLILHGGGNRGAPVAVSPTQLSVLRMVPIAKQIARVGAGRVAVFRLLNSSRGWADHPTPVDDVRWALDQLAERFGGRRPTCLVGHSLGGRAALFAADGPEVRSVAALAPWFKASDAPSGLEGRRILIVHGSRDRVASPERSAAVADRLGAITDVDYVTVEGATHGMLRHHREFTDRATEFATETLLSDPDLEERQPAG